MAFVSQNWEEIEKIAHKEGWSVIGVDEAGRGPLFGPVVAGACLLANPNPIEGLACSKTLSEKRRAILFEQITAMAPAHAIAQASVAEIDKLNILQASLLAMHRAVASVIQKSGLKPEQCLVLVDGNKLPKWEYRSQAIVKGDAKVPAISAGSILAKVSRDRWCAEQAQRYPQYELDAHMGYPTPRHLELLKAHGATVLHRKSFKPVREVLADAQQSIF